ncbi:hypothetical protein PR048_023399 [Dryococelus australis]|uniref:Uncharacterized protein n=1 Tax=Dryococelus australis TaxID=614101 RepID=A0ABQ9GU29_9NEOP|nr:hypothetical protein PR048_023399 [Dryococelus australis]
MFLKSVGEIYDKFLRLMQCNEPCIHILYAELYAPIQSFLSRIIKRLDLHNIENTCPSEDIDVGCVTRKETTKLKEKETKFLFHEVKKFTIYIIEYLLDKVLIENMLLRSIQLLHPLFRQGCSWLLRVVTDRLCDECKLYMAENLAVVLYMAEVLSGYTTRIDTYWSAIQKLRNSLGELKYPLLSCFARAALTLSHGQADFTPDCTNNKWLMYHQIYLICHQTKRWCLSGASIASVQCNLSSKRWCLSGASIANYFRDASSKYKAYLEDCKIEKSELDSKSKRKYGVGRLENLKKEGKTLQEAIQASHCLILEANKRLSAACKSKNMQEIFAPQAFL